MREARMLVPVNDNKGRELATLRQLVQKTLLEFFGGFTETLVRGGWMNPDGKPIIEPMLAYDVLIGGVSDERQLDSVAKVVQYAAGQEAVYVRHSDGNVILVR